MTQERDVFSLNLETTPDGERRRVHGYHQYSGNQDHVVTGKQQIPATKAVTFDHQQPAFGIKPPTWITDVSR